MRHSILALLLLSATAHAADIPIAAVGPLTGSNAMYGEEMRRGSELAVADINAAGGVLGRKLALTLMDDSCDPRQAVNAAHQLASKEVALVVGHFCSGAAIPAASVYADADIPAITPSATNPKLTESAFAQHWRNIYRTCGRDDQQGRVAGQYLLTNFKDKPIAIIDDRSAYGRGLADETVRVLADGGVTPVLRETVSPGERDFSVLVAKLKRAGVRAIYFGGYPVEAGLIVRQAADASLGAVLLGGDALSGSEFWQITGAAGAGTLFTFPPDMHKQASAAAVIARFRAQGYEPAGYSLYTYAAVQVFAQAADQAKSIKMGDLAKVLHGATFDTVVGPIAYDEKGDIKGRFFTMWRWAEGGHSQLPQP
jgi:branched-chain amino acid transport system substrate-binding protein